MTNEGQHIREAAIGWVIRLRDPAFDDWDGFTAWLEADARHNAAYETAALADVDMAQVLSVPAPRPIMAVPSRAPARRLVLGSVLAASLVAFFGFSALQSDTYAIETVPGERRSVTLASGDRIDMNGGTRLVLDRDNVRFAELERGEALFTVRHDEARPFVVQAGDTVLRDVGTVFNVTHGEGALDLAVSEGAVLFDPEGEAVTVPAGRALRSTDEGKAAVRDVALTDVAGWREGRLAYSDTPLSQVAADLSRNLGVEVRVSGRAQRAFSGVILLERGDPAFFRKVGALLDVQVRQSGEGWVLVAA
jgi:transmembrane sensor